MPGDDLQKDTAAIALDVFAVELDKGVFAGGQAEPGGTPGMS